MYERVEAPHKMPVKKLFKNCHIKNEFDLILRNEKNKKRIKIKEKEKNINQMETFLYQNSSININFYLKSLEQGFTANLVYRLNQNISK